MNMKSVTPRFIAYAAVQVHLFCNNLAVILLTYYRQARFAISSQEHWTTMDGLFDYQAFFWHIVGMFDDGEGLDIIKLYNQ